MSKRLNTLSKFAMAAGVALLTTMVANLAPASAAKVNFSFTTEGNKQGSFDLDTSVADGNPNNAQGAYTGAIQNYTFDGSAPGTKNLSTYISDPGTTRLDLNDFSFLDFNDSTGQLVNQLFSDPSVYNTSFANGRIVDNNFNSMTVTGLTATDPTAVPEPTTVVGSLVALGMGLQMKRKMKKGNLSA